MKDDTFFGIDKDSTNFRLGDSADNMFEDAGWVEYGTICDFRFGRGVAKVKKKKLNIYYLSSCLVTFPLVYKQCRTGPHGV